MVIFDRLLTKFGELRVRSKAVNLQIDKRGWVAQSDNTQWTIMSMMGSVKLELSINKAKFTIGWEQHVHLLNALGNAMQWFYDDEKKDLFVMGDDGQLYFNNDYNALKALAYSGQRTHNFLEIRPVVVERDNFKRYEGVILMINNIDDYVCLTVEELVSLTHIISSFDYSRELCVFMQMAAVDKQLNVIDSSFSNDAKSNPNNPFRFK